MPRGAKSTARQKETCFLPELVTTIFSPSKEAAIGLLKPFPLSVVTTLPVATRTMEIVLDLIWRTKGGGWHFSETKTSRSRRTIPLPNPMILQLREHKRRQAETRLKLGPAYQNHDLVFATDEGGPLSIQNLTSATTNRL